MTIYALHRYSKGTDTVGPLEAFPSVERASVALQLRARTQKSGTVYADEEHRAPRPVRSFPEADMTGYMLVWRRPSHAPRPASGEDPDELWRLTPGGGVLKEPYAWGKRYTLAESDVEERRERAVRACFEMQPVQVGFLAQTDGMLWRRILTDLAGQDEKLEEAILRLMSPFMKIPPKHPHA